jgi:hypothetical protein
VPLTNIKMHEFAQVQGMLEALRVAAMTICKSADLAADTPEFRRLQMDGFGDPINPTSEIIGNLARELESLVSRAKEAIQAEMHHDR